MGYGDKVRAGSTLQKFRKGDQSTRLGNIYSRAKQEFQFYIATFKQALYRLKGCSFSL